MSVFSAFSTGIQAATGSTGGSSAEASQLFNDRYFGDQLVMHSAAGMHVSPERAKRLTTVFACTSKKATGMAMLPFKIYKDDGKGGSKVVRQHPLYDILYSQPNHLQTAYEFKWMMQSHVELRGNAYAEIIPGPRGAVDELMPMHPDRVRVEQLLGSGRLRYRYSDPLTNSERVLMQDEVFHLRDLTDNVVLGQSRIVAGCEMLGLGLLQQDYRARFMANDATPGALITGTAFKTVEDEDAFVDSLKKSRTEENRGRPFMLPPGVDMKSLSVTPVEAQLMDAMRLTDTQICSFFNVLPHTIGVDAGKAATFASTEQFNLMHVQQCILPMCVMWQQAVQRSLITSPIYFMRPSLEELLMGDQETRATVCQILIQAGVICPDEAREMWGFNPISDGSGQRFWNPLNWGLANRTPALTTGATRSGGVATDTTGDDDEEQDDTDTGVGDDEQAAAMLPVVRAVVEHGRYRPNRKAA